MKRRQIAALLTLLPGVLMLVLSACGGSSSSSTKPTPTGSRTRTATATKTAKPTKTPTQTAATSTPTPTATGTRTPTPTSTATTAAGCLTSQRQLNVTNNSSQPMWVSGGGGALRAVCVVNNTTSCLTSSYNATTGSCTCGSSNGQLSCPGTSDPTGVIAGGKNCQCATNSDCGSGAGCNTNTKLCYYTLPNPTSFSGFPAPTPSPGSWNWELPATGETATFCLDQGTVTFNGQQVPSAVWWSGGVFARTGCHSDGTNCLTGDCNTANFVPNADCPVGSGSTNPAVTIAEFTLQSEATDFYDITDINGANIGEQMAPIPTATQTPGSVPTFYWCSAPGSNCAFNYGNFTKNVPLAAPTDATELLMQVAQGCTQGTNAGCPTGFQCNGTSGATNGVCFMTCTSSSQCPGTQQCRKASNGQSYCQCSQQSDCLSGQFCGTQLIPGVGVIQQQCGSFEGWTTLDTLCSQDTNNMIGDPASPMVNCKATLTNGDGNNTNLLQLLGCIGANATSCYNSAASTNGCCGCGTSSANPLFSDWPSQTSLTCSGASQNNTTWASDAQPWLVNLKQACPSAYSYPFDDATSTFQCQAQGSTNLLGYTVTFTDLAAPPSPE